MEGEDWSTSARNLSEVVVVAGPDGDGTGEGAIPRA